jgi:hypothetical protein
VRIDLTIIPKLFRYDSYSSAFLCRPDGQETQFSMTAKVSDYIPRPGNCADHTNRAAPFGIVDSAYETVHPEEYAWLQGRLGVTGPKVKSFVQDKIGRTLTDGQAKLKIAVANSGGGKRAMLQSLGKRT